VAFAEGKEWLSQGRLVALGVPARFEYKFDEVPSELFFFVTQHGSFFMVY
jgi:hypothetical protein